MRAETVALLGEPRNSAVLFWTVNVRAAFSLAITVRSASTISRSTIVIDNFFVFVSDLAQLTTSDGSMLDYVVDGDEIVVTLKTTPRKNTTMLTSYNVACLHTATANRTVGVAWRQSVTMSSPGQRRRDLASAPPGAWLTRSVGAVLCLSLGDAKTDKSDKRNTTTK